MADPNLIAYLYPTGDRLLHLENALRTIRMAENEPRRIEPLIEDRSQRSSQAPEDEANDCLYENNDGDNDGYHDQEEASNIPNNDYSPGLQLRFDEWRKNREGFVIGTSRNCDIVLPRRESLSGLAPRQCVITFDDQGRLILRDVQDRRKKGGTAVTYNGKGEQKCRTFTWILSGHKFPERNQPINIILHENLKFQIVVAHQDIHSAAYQENVAQFRLRVATNLDDISFGGFGLESLNSTAAPSGAQSPIRDVILLDNGELGRGAQAVVSRVWNVSTGLEYASKEPLSKRFRKRLATEVDILKQINHEHIVKCIPEWSTAMPEPRLVIEYIPLGTLEQQAKKRAITGEESVAILHQGLSGLRYLHEREDPIVHRDIKPSNILVQSRTPHIHIKLSDFGYSKESQDYLKTVCGTRRYAAPEVHNRQSYDAAVDVWSLGVVVFQYSHGLPDLDRTTDFDGVNCSRILEALTTKTKQSHCPMLRFLSTAMLVAKPDLRYSAHRKMQRQ
ncbi:CAMK family protein kinase [Pleurostoma richardsiae]|uniref:CAMK family protein kinase n=1 Tax=Pleurostoma richardsiae TaxID=41990 RepID=A0AA38RDM6_9PEZI|nr:CAMK family protein kinase [Pleurostoma richardsiae]